MFSYNMNSSDRDEATLIRSFEDASCSQEIDFKKQTTFSRLSNLYDIDK